MIPAPFSYVRAGSVDEAVAALVEHGDEARLLAGGHSLLPLMRLRLATPGVLVDLDRVEALQGVRTSTGSRSTTAGSDSAGNGENPGHLAGWADGVLSVGALTTHRQLVADPSITAHCGVLGAVAATIGDPQVRHRGTIGGALAHGDAAGDLPAAMVALDAVMVAQGPNGQRDIAARDFFLGYLTTALRADEVLVEVRVPTLDGWRWHYERFAVAARGWAVAGALALVRHDGDTVGDVRVALTNVGSTPVRCTQVEDHVRGMAIADVSADELATAASDAARDLDPPSDLHASSDYRRHLVEVLVQRALAACLPPT